MHHPKDHSLFDFQLPNLYPSPMSLAFSTFLLLSWRVPLNYHDAGFTINSQLLARPSLAIAQDKTSCDPLLGPFEMEPSFNMVITTRTTQ